MKNMSNFSQENGKVRIASVPKNKVRGPGRADKLMKHMLGIGTSSSCIYKLMKHQYWLLHRAVVIYNYAKRV